MKITEAQARQLIQGLANAFAIEKAILMTRPSLKYGRTAYYNEGVIYLSYKGLEDWIVVHEFAHHFCHVVMKTEQKIKELENNIRILKDRLKGWNLPVHSLKRMASQSKGNGKFGKLIGSGKRKRHHDELFAECLKRSIEASGVDYPIEWEYKKVKDYLLRNIRKEESHESANSG